MPVPSVLELGSTAGAAAGEIVTRRIDAGLGRVQPFRRITDFYRLGLLIVGAVGSFMDAVPELTRPLFLVGLYGTTVSLGESLITLGQVAPQFQRQHALELGNGALEGSKAAVERPIPGTNRRQFFTVT